MVSFPKNMLNKIPCTNKAVISHAVHGLTLSNTAHNMLAEACGKGLSREDYIRIIPRNAKVLVDIVQKLGKQAGEDIELVPLKKRVKYIVVGDHDAAYEEIQEDHMVWGNPTSYDRQGKRSWILASQDQIAILSGWIGCF